MLTIARALSEAFPGLASSDDVADQVAYARDLWPRHHLAVRSGAVAEHRPGAIVWPRTTAEVVSLVRWARARAVPLVPFGAGSGVCAAILPRRDVVVVDLKRMSAWRALDEGAPSLTVEAGQMGLPMEEALNGRGYTLGHFPSSILCSTVGGWVATRSAGQCSGYYGKIEDMLAGLECVTGAGDVVAMKARPGGASLLPLVVGSEGTLAVVTAATFRLHPQPKERAFASFAVPSTRQGWEAMRALFQAGFRPAVARLYDPFDALLARRGRTRTSTAATSKPASAPGLGARALPHLLRHPSLFGHLTEGPLSRALGPALLVLVFEGGFEAPQLAAEARAVIERSGGTYEGEEAARRWYSHRYAVSYRQAPIFAAGAFVDTMEVAAPWSRLEALYDGVRRALGAHAFVMAHFSHAYEDGCCIYFTFAGSAARDREPGESWDEASERTYDRAWRAALHAATAAGGTLSHHHGVGRSKAPQLESEVGAGIEVLRAVKRAFDPDGILNPGALFPPAGAGTGASS